MTDDYDDMKQRWHGVPPEEPDIRPEDALTDAECEMFGDEPVDFGLTNLGDK